MTKAKLKQSKKAKRTSKKLPKKGLARALPAVKQSKSTKLSADKPNTSAKFSLTIGILFIIAGGLMAFQPLMQYWQGHYHKVLSAPAPAPARTPQIEAATKVDQIVEGKPVRLVIPKLNIDVPVADGIYNPKTKTWTLSKSKAHYAVMTTEPNNQAGNTFIYGHNRPEVFSRLAKLPIGQTVQVYTDNNHVFTYRYRSAYETNPNDDSIFRYQGPPILTLQTCSGLWYQNRYLMTFDLVGVA